MAAYRPRIAQLATAASRTSDAEFDDLEQVGLIRVWQMLQIDRLTTTGIINAMRNEMKRARRRGITGNREEEDVLLYGLLPELAELIDSELGAVDGEHV